MLVLGIYDSHLPPVQQGLTEAARHQMLIDWNNTQADYPRNLCIHQMFEAQAQRTPDAVAVVFEEEQLTYRDLNSRANQLAHYLGSLGVGPELLVGIAVERSLEMVVGLLGILKAGGAYVPLDPAYPRARIEYLLQDASVAVLLTDQRVRAALPDQQAKTVSLDADWPLIARERISNPLSQATASNLAYVIYTSGSTGNPKGVAIEHRAAVNFICWAMQVFTPEDLAGVLASTSVCFDLSVFELFVTLCCGGKVILARNALHLPTLAAKNEVTLINTVPSAIAELLRIGGIPASVRTVNLAGERLPTSLVDKLYALPHVRQVFDLYGPSETTTYSTYARRDAAAPATIGRPLANTQVYIVDRNLLPVAMDEEGEILIGGAGLARGYLNRPDLTAEKFIPNPFSDMPGARLYKTGDLARYLPDGNIEFLGRSDHQVKIRGFRIEMGEIESVLRQHPAVSETVVVAREDVPGDQRLVAYLVAAPHAELSPAVLRDFLKGKLPDYMAPSAFVILRALPLTPNGKIDRRALPAPDQGSHDPTTRLVGPRDTLELQMTNLWEKVLGIHPIEVRDNFFELGGHSLLAARMFAGIEKLFGKRLPLGTLLQAPTIEQLAGILRKKEWAAPWSSLVAIQPGGSRPPLFLIHAVGGNVLNYRDLVRYLGPDQPLYGIQALGLDGKQEPHTRIADMAAHYIQEMRRLQPHGPYYLGGLSFGGMVAFEMAQQLQAHGQSVGLLAMLDTPGPGYASSLATRFSHDLTGFLRLGLSQKLQYLQQGMGTVRARIQRIVWKWASRFRRLTGRRSSDTLHDIMMTNYHAGLNYKPHRYPGLVTLFRAKDQALGVYDDPYSGWAEMADGGVEIHEVPGSHADFHHEPHVRILAERLSACLRRAQERNPVSICTGSNL